MFEKMFYMEKFKKVSIPNMFLSKLQEREIFVFSGVCLVFVVVVFFNLFF